MEVEVYFYINLSISGFDLKYRRVLKYFDLDSDGYCCVKYRCSYSKVFILERLDDGCESGWKMIQRVGK